MKAEINMTSMNTVLPLEGIVCRLTGVLCPVSFMRENTLIRNDRKNSYPILQRNSDSIR